MGLVFTSIVDSPKNTLRVFTSFPGSVKNMLRVITSFYVVRKIAFVVFTSI